MQYSRPAVVQRSSAEFRCVRHHQTFPNFNYARWVLKKTGCAAKNSEWVLLESKKKKLIRTRNGDRERPRKRIADSTGRNLRLRVSMCFVFVTPKSRRADKMRIVSNFRFDLRNLAATCALTNIASPKTCNLLRTRLFRLARGMNDLKKIPPTHMCIKLLRNAWRTCTIIIVVFTSHTRRIIMTRRRYYRNNNYYYRLAFIRARGLKKRKVQIFILTRKFLA